MFLCPRFRPLGVLLGSTRLLVGLLPGTVAGGGGAPDAGSGPSLREFPHGGADACTPRQGVTLLYGPSICTRSVQMDLRRNQVRRPFPTPRSGTLWVSGESLRNRRVSCLPRWTVCPTRSPSQDKNRSTCRGECDRGLGTQGPAKGGKGGRGRTNTQGAGLGQGAGAEGGSREGGLPREFRTVLALAGGAEVKKRRRENRGRGTERKEAGDPATRDEGQGKVREGEQTGGRTWPGGRGGEGGREGALPSELLRTVLALAGGQRVRNGRAEKGVTLSPTTERAARSVRGQWARRGAAACCHKAARPQRCSVLCACVVSCIEGRQGRGKRARAGRKR